MDENVLITQLNLVIKQLLDMIDNKFKATDDFIEQFADDLNEIKIGQARLEEQLKSHSVGCPINRAYVQKEIETAVALELAKVPEKTKSEQFNKTSIIVMVVGIIVAFIALLIALHPLLK